MRVLVVTVLGWVCVAGSAVASPPWPQEPAAVFGITLGKPFPGAGEIGDCPVFAPFRREPHSGELCVDGGEDFSAERIPLRNVPLDGITDKATVLLHDGQVRSIVVTFDAKRYDAMKALLIARYGAPHAQSNEAVTDTGSATSTAEVVS